MELRAYCPLGLPLRLPRGAEPAVNRYACSSLDSACPSFQFNAYGRIPTGNFALLPLRTRTRGPAIPLPPLPADVTDLTIEASHDSYDPLDEVLSLFRANTFFRNFEIKGPADRVLIYGILFVSDVLSKIKPNMNRREAEKVRQAANVSQGHGGMLFVLILGFYRLS